MNVFKHMRSWVCPVCVFVCAYALEGVAVSQGRVDSLHKDSIEEERQSC